MLLTHGVLLILLGGAVGFDFRAARCLQYATQQSALKMSMSNKQDSIGKFVQKGFKIAATLLASGLLSSGAVLADTLEEANSKLSGYGFPPILYVPSGLSPLVSEFGRGSIREEMRNPILVQFAYPSFWVVQKTSVNVNGEAGTISANGK